MNVLLTNDDGIRAPGLMALVRAFSGAGHRMFVCAPDRERSAASHSGTFNRPLHAEAIDLPGAERAWAVDGTPSDCAALGLFLAREAGIDLVVSGINRGMNMGGACVYSGTVAAALEAAMDGTQALAVSLYIDPWGKGEEDFDSAAKAALRVAEWLPSHPLPTGCMYNLNVPALPYEQIKGFVAATLAPVFLDLPDYVRTENGGWFYRSAERTFEDESWDLVRVEQGYCALTKLTWDMRMNADDGELNEIEL